MRGLCYTLGGRRIARRTATSIPHTRTPHRRPAIASSFIRTNHKIRVPRIRVILADGTMAGIMETRDALRIAQEAHLDLVEVSPGADPPVCRIMDFGKFRYDEGQRKKQARRNQAKVVVKEVKFHANVDENDYQVKLRNIRGFLGEGCKIKLTLQYRGRENAHKELGDEVVARVIRDTADIAVVEQQPKLMGRSLSGMIGPRPVKKTGGGEKAPAPAPAQ